MRVEIVYSRDDGGYYCEIVCRMTGKTLHTTDVYRAKTEALAAAGTWMEEVVASN